MTGRSALTILAVVLFAAALVGVFQPPSAPDPQLPAPSASRTRESSVSTTELTMPSPLEAPTPAVPKPRWPPGRAITVELTDVPASQYLQARPTENDAFYRDVVQAVAGSRAQYDVDLGLAAREFVYQAAEFRGEAPSDVRDFLTRGVGALAGDTAFQHVRTTSEADSALRQAVAAVLAAPPSGSGPLHIGVGEIYTPGAQLPRDIGVVATRLPIAMEPAPRTARPGAVWNLRGRLRAPWREIQALVLRPDGRIVTYPPAIRGDVVEVSVDVGAMPGTVELQLIGKGPEGPGKLVQLAVEVGQPLPRRYTTRLAPSEAALRTADDAANYAFELLNADRARHGVRPLQWDAELARIARDHSADMRDHNFFAHVSPTSGLPADRLAAAQYRSTASAENLAHNGTIYEAQAGLLHSLGHRRNLLDPQMQVVGIGVAGKDDDQGRRSWWLTQLFARPVAQLDGRAAAQKLRADIGAKRQQADLGTLEPDADLDDVAQTAAHSVLAGDIDAGPSLALAQARQRGLMRGQLRAWAAQVSDLQAFKLPESVLAASARRLGAAVVQDTRALDGRVAVVLLVGD